MNKKENIPWVEKYRPTCFDDIVLDPLNKKIMNNIIKYNSFPNLLFYGPPGTGKTTTIINLIKYYQEKNNQTNKELTIHLNASDDRGIDIIRNHICQFVNSKTLFNKGTKFIILDEVDSMTKNAQQALKYLLQSFTNNVRFCLICNYISRIDDSLQNEFVRIRFNQLPTKNITHFLKTIIERENVAISTENIHMIQNFYKSDIRSMINYIQSNNNNIKNNVITNQIWENLFIMVLSTKKKDIIKTLNKELDKISYNYNIDVKNIIKEFLNFIICCKKKYVSSEFLTLCEILMHMQDPNITYYTNYFAINLHRVLVLPP